MLEMAIVLLIVGLVIVLTLPINNMIVSNQRRATSLQNLKNVQAALSNFVTLNKRLPCPANGKLTPGAALFGKEAPVGGGICSGSQQFGVVPWVTLGLGPSEAQDAWANFISYRVGYGLTQNSALDMTSCDPAGTMVSTPGAPISFLTCSPSCTGTTLTTNCTAPRDFILNKGLNVSDGTNVIMNYANFTGAAYVLISHGDNGYGAVSNMYVDAATIGTWGALEDANKSSKTVSNSIPVAFVDAPFSDGDNTTTYFDDIIIRPPLLSVINQAQLGPRSH